MNAVLSAQALSQIPYCEARRSIDLDVIRRIGGLNNHRVSLICWTIGDVDLGSAVIVKDEVGLLIEDGQPVARPPTPSQRILLTSSKTNFGGTRLWMLCPKCHNRCRILYDGPTFLCRKCQGLRHASQYENRVSRAYTKLVKIRRRIGAVAVPLEYRLGRPKNMHQTTFVRISVLHQKLVDDYLGATQKMVQKLVARFDQAGLVVPKPTGSGSTIVRRRL